MDVMQDTFDVEVDGDRYTFRIPTIRFRMEVGAKATEIRLKASPSSQTAERMGLADWQAIAFSRACAFLELYLVRSTATWVYGSEDPALIDMAKPPVVDFERFPADREDTVEAVGAAFEEARTRFRKRGDTDGRPPGTEAVAGVGGAGTP